jgi:hypothetical protein
MRIQPSKVGCGCIAATTVVVHCDYEVLQWFIGKDILALLNARIWVIYNVNL